MAERRELRDRISAVSGALSPAQTRVARLVDDAPAVIAFGTVAEVATEADTSPQTVLRFASRIGHSGFPELQDEVRAELLARLPPAARRIRERPGSDLRGEVLAADRDNLERSLDQPAAVMESVTALLADERRDVSIVVADSWAGVGQLLADQLGQLRDGVRLVAGNPTRVVRDVSRLDTSSVLVALDVRRYERWVIDAVEQARAADATVIGVSDGSTSPLLGLADHRLVVGVGSPSPFESAAGVVALLHLVVTEVAARLRRRATVRLDAAERAWTERNTLLEG